MEPGQGKVASNRANQDTGRCPRGAAAHGRGALKPVELFLCAVAMAWPGRSSAQVYTISPSADGTIVDGRPYGELDGVPDAWDWTFNESGYEGSIARVTDPPSLAFEHRVVWEYSLSSVALTPPVVATLTFALRGPPRFPADDARVAVFAYPADLRESSADFSAVPAILLASVSVEPYQPLTSFSVDVSDVVAAALGSTDKRVAFRFQIDPQSPSTSSQAFMDAVDAITSTKPALSVRQGLLGDADGDGDLDLDDFAWTVDCLSGPARLAAPGCQNSDFDLNNRIDLRDLAAFLNRTTDPGG
jgi:hypothetical protein